ncbi:L-seryl-tRNA(Sec) selenium transferase [Clostridium tetanomorphum]|nr:L-seryl-tRNA(Sec) selenium transferase [Clostridium tetanomorphum]
MPQEKIETYVLKIKSNKFKSVEMERLLRENYIPIIVRINKDEVIMDLRTIMDKDYDSILEALKYIDEL